MAETSDQRRVTAADIARSLGVSRATVGFVLNNTQGQTISATTRERVLAEASRLGYRPHLAARALASGQSKIVLLVLPDWPVDYTLRQHLDEASLALDEGGYSLVTMTPHPGGQARPLWETLQPDLVLGMVPFTPEQVAVITASGNRVISPDVAPEGFGDDLGHTLGPRLQVEHLDERGHHQIAFATTGDVRLASLATEREELARATAARVGLAFRADVVDDENISAVIDAWLESGVTAVATYNDDIAALVVGSALRRGLEVPGRLAVIGHDDTPLAQRFVPSISTIRVDHVGLGRYFAALALQAIEDAPAHVAPPTSRATVVARETS